jgi:hypothetical protein
VFLLLKKVPAYFRLRWGSHVTGDFLAAGAGKRFISLLLFSFLLLARWWNQHIRPGAEGYGLGDGFRWRGMVSCLFSLLLLLLLNLVLFARTVATLRFRLLLRIAPFIPYWGLAPRYGTMSFFSVISVICLFPPSSPALYRVVLSHSFPFVLFPIASCWVIPSLDPALLVLSALYSHSLRLPNTTTLVSRIISSFVYCSSKRPGFLHGVKVFNNHEALPLYAYGFSHPMDAAAARSRLIRP